MEVGFENIVDVSEAISRPVNGWGYNIEKMVSWVGIFWTRKSRLLEKVENF
jgi:hypothetical protein